MKTLILHSALRQPLPSTGAGKHFPRVRLFLRCLLTLTIYNCVYWGSKDNIFILAPLQLELSLHLNLPSAEWTSCYRWSAPLSLPPTMNTTPNAQPELHKLDLLSRWYCQSSLSPLPQKGSPTKERSKDKATDMIE